MLPGRGMPILSGRVSPNMVTFSSCSIITGTNIYDIYRFLIYIINFIQCFIIVYSFCVYSSLSNACGQPVQTFPNNFNHQVLLALLDVIQESDLTCSEMSF